MTGLPHALGCPSCPHVEVLASGPDAGISRMTAHLDAEHRADGTPNRLLAQTRKLTEEEVTAL